MKKDCLFNKLFILLFCLLLPMSLYAYLDPGTGSYVLQVIVAAFFGVLYSIKVYWSKFKAFFTGKKNNTDNNVGDK